MNQQVPIAVQPGKHLFTHREALRLWETDFFNGRRFELLNGEVYLMPMEGFLHQGLRERLLASLYRHFFLTDLPLIAGSNGPIRLGEHQAPEPDVYVRPAGLALDQVGGEETLLVIEICVSTQEKDFKIKPQIYAAHGVREFWLIEPEAARTVVRRGPRPDGSWAQEWAVPAGERIEALLVQGFAMTLAELLG